MEINGLEQECHDTNKRKKVISYWIKRKELEYCFFCLNN